MKQLIVLTASIMLGIFIFSLVGGPLSSAVGRLWRAEVETRTMREYSP